MPASAELFTVVPPDVALARLLAQWRPSVIATACDTADALGRVLAAPVLARENLPAFRRSTVDGYAVRAFDTFGASPGLPALLSVAAEAQMGTTVDIALAPGTCVSVHTGGMLPADADAVVMIEHTQHVGDVAASPQIEIMRAVAVGENVLGVGEDIVDGAQAYAAGHTLRPHDIGALMSLGMTKVDVAAPPRVAIVSSGDEIVAPTVAPVAGQVRDVNSYALGALVRQHGGAPMLYGIVPDRRDALDAALRRAHAECDIVMISAGSSVGARDLTVDAIAALGAPGVLAHGVALKPGKPAIVALCAGKAVFGLPGNPASALTVAELFVVPALRVALGASPVRAHTVRARLSRNVASSAGRVDVVPVNLAERDGELWATPIFGKSNLIYTLVRADGRITISLNDGGAREGDWVDVRL